MPLIRISLRAGRTPAFKIALADGVYEAMRAVFDVPEEDRFAMIHEHGDGEFIYSPTYLGMDRSDGLVIIQISCNNTRSTEQKQALYRRIADRLAENPGVRPDDIMINLLEGLGKPNEPAGAVPAQH